LSGTGELELGKSRHQANQPAGREGWGKGMAENRSWDLCVQEAVGNSCSNAFKKKDGKKGINTYPAKNRRAGPGAQKTLKRKGAKRKTALETSIPPTVTLCT